MQHRVLSVHVDTPIYSLVKQLETLDAGKEFVTVYICLDNAVFSTDPIKDLRYVLDELGSYFRLQGWAYVPHSNTMEVQLRNVELKDLVYAQQIPQDYSAT